MGGYDSRRMFLGILYYSQDWAGKESRENRVKWMESSKLPCLRGVK